MGKLDSRTVVVFDYNWGGHIPAYHRLIVESVLREGGRVASLSGGNQEVLAHVQHTIPSALERLLAPPCPALGRPPARDSKLAFLRWVPGGFSLWSHIRRNPRLRVRHALQRWKAAQALVSLHRSWLGASPLLFFPYLDDMLEPDLPLATGDTALPWAGLHMSASDLRHPGLRPGMERNLRLLASPGCRGLAVLDEVAAQAIRERAPTLNVATLPDTADARVRAGRSEIADELARRAGGRKIVGLLGHLSSAKNLALFLELAVAPRNRDIFFFLAGQYEALALPPEVRHQIEDAAAGKLENVWATPGRIPDEGGFNLLFRHVDVVFAVYRDFTRSSNILTKAALFRRPILVATGFCMADRVEKYRLGLAAPADSLAGCESALRRLLDEGAPRASHNQYESDFSLAAFEARLIAFLDDCFTLPPPADRAQRHA